MTCGLFKIVSPHTGEKTDLTHATIYVEDRAASELAFAETTLERRVVPKVLEVALAYNPRDRSVEICAKGGKKIRDQYAQAFAKHFAPPKFVTILLLPRAQHCGAD